MDQDRHLENDPDPEDQIGGEADIIGGPDLGPDPHKTGQERDRCRQDDEKGETDACQKKQDHRGQKTEQNVFLAGFQSRQNKGEGFIGDQRKGQNESGQQRNIKDRRDVFGDLDGGKG